MDHLQLTKTGRSVSQMLSLNPRIKCAAAILFIFVSALYLNFADWCAILGSYLTWDQFELRKGCTLTERKALIVDIGQTLKTLIDYLL